MYLEKINSPEDVKKLSLDEMNELSAEIRQVLLKKLSEHGGHIGPNLGIVELTVALHYVFNSPKDKIVYDVSHQSYIHKMLTGRKDAFINSEKYDEVSGYSNPEESEHDFFNIGHTSTSISLACGLAKARDLKDEKDNVIAIIGDGSLSGGEAYEGLNNAAEAGTNMIIIVNDNDMSIAENYGGLYKNLKELRDTEGRCECNFFKAMGVIESGVEDKTDYSKLNKYQVTKAGKDVAVIALGDFYQLGQAVVTKLSNENGIEATLINPKYITGIDEELLESLKKEHKLVITLEDGILDGGFGEKIARYYGPSDMKVLNYGIKKELLDRYVPEELMKKNRLTEDQMVEDIMSIIK